MKLLISCILILLLGVCVGASNEEQQHTETPKEKESNSTLFSVIENALDVAKEKMDSSTVVIKAKNIYSASTELIENIFDWTVNTVKFQWKKFTE